MLNGIMRGNLSTLSAVAAAIALSALAGCAHHHPASTRIAIAPNVPPPNLNAPHIDYSTAGNTASTTHPAIAAADAGAGNGHGVAAHRQSGASGTMSNASRETGHVLGEGARDTGHGAAVVGRETGHLAMQTARATGDLLTKSAVGIHNSPPESLSPRTIDVDEAMQLRDWDAVNCYYSNGSTIAGPVGFPFQPAPNLPQPRAVIVEPALFLLNTLIFPTEYFRVRPWDPVQWKAASIEPTYTAVPPLPAENAP